MHFGKINKLCPDLEVHGSKIISSECEKYLGSLITTDMNNKKAV